MRFPRPLVPGFFQSRLNRFLGVALLDGVETLCFIPNPGRMKELLNHGTRVYLTPVQSETRKTRYNLSLVDHQGVLVSVDSNVPNKLVHEAIDRSLIEPFQDFHVEKAEHTFGESRLDFLLEGDTGKLFGSRHLKTLTKGLEHGRAAVFFLIQRPDANSFRPNEETDSDFAANLSEADKKGVEVYAYTSHVNLDGVFLGNRVPIDF
jgi:sugar fermentation stimulation protein A